MICVMMGGPMDGKEVDMPGCPPKIVFPIMPKTPIYYRGDFEDLSSTLEVSIQTIDYLFAYKAWFNPYKAYYSIDPRGVPNATPWTL